jgi:hypothetical protein
MGSIPSARNVNKHLNKKILQLLKQRYGRDVIYGRTQGEKYVGESTKEDNKKCAMSLHSNEFVLCSHSDKSSLKCIKLISPLNITNILQAAFWYKSCIRKCLYLKFGIIFWHKNMAEKLL